MNTSYQISFLVNRKFWADSPFVHNFEYYDSKHEVSLNGRSRIITVELDKLDNILEKAVKNMTSQERWAVFFRYITDKTKRDIINKILEAEEGIAMAGEVLLTISRDQEEKLRLMSEYKAYADRQSQIVQAKLEIAGKLLRMNMPPQQVAEATGLQLDTVLREQAGYNSIGK